MIKRIILEGSDQQGKTTLANYLREQLGWEINHFGKPKENFNFFIDYITKPNVISDRNFLSEIVYSKINNKECRIKDVDLLQNALIGYGTILIMLDRGAEFKFDKKRHEDYSKKDIEKAIEIYREEFTKLKMTKFIINPNCNCYESNVDIIINMIKGQ
jgi:thymidylate kinase